jgi:hypothetical protein
MAKIYTIPRNITEHRESYIYQNRKKRKSKEITESGRNDAIKGK